MTLSFHPEAKEEFNEAIEYYEDCEPGLGYDFSIEGHAAIQNIINYPTAWKVIEDDVRGCLVNRFPYSILYSSHPKTPLPWREGIIGKGEPNCNRLKLQTNSPPP